MVHTIRWMVMREPPTEHDRMGAQILPLFLLGGFVGGASAGGLVAFAAYLISLLLGRHLAAFAIASSLVGMVYVAKHLGWIRLPRLSLNHQVPEAWRNIFPPSTASFLYSAALGLTFFTRISSSAMYPFVILLLGFSRWPWAIVLLFAITGFTRSATALVVPIKRWAYVQAITVDDELEPLSSQVAVARAVVGVATSAGLLAWALITWT